MKSEQNPMLVIDKNKCKKDFICVPECPFDLIVPGKDGFPSIRKAARKYCIACGHCEAICPHQALTLTMLPEGGCIRVRKELITPENIDHFLKSRRSIRSYRDKQLPRETLEKLLDMARYAPSAHNVQPVNWIMIENRDKIRELTGLIVGWMAENKLFPGIIKSWARGEDKVLRNAPNLAVAYAPVDGENPAEDCSISATYMDLAAHGLRLGTCWAGFLMMAAKVHPPIKKRLDIPEGYEVYSALILGYPKFRYRRIPPREPVKVRWM